MSRNLIYTHWMGNLPIDYSEYLLPSVIRYCNYLNCDFRMVNRPHPSLDASLGPEFHKLPFLSDFANDYDKIVYMDPDIYVTTFALDIFGSFGDEDVSLYSEFSETVNSDPNTNYRWRKFKDALGLNETPADSYWGNSGVLRVNTANIQPFIDTFINIVSKRDSLFPPVAKSARNYRRVMDNVEPWLTAALVLSGVSVGEMDLRWNCSYARRKQDKIDPYFLHFNGIHAHKRKISKDWYRKCYSL